MSMFYAFSILCCFGNILGDPLDWIKTNRCLNFDMKNDLNISRLSGNWYGAMMHPPIERLHGYRCFAINFFFDENNEMSMFTSFVRTRANGSAVITERKIPRPNDRFSDGLKVVGLKKTEFQSIWILETDYDSYLVFYTCGVINGEILVQKVILTREIEAMNSTLQKALSDAERLWMTWTENLENFTHTRCPIF